MISVIVTVYNKEPYIQKCIESIENNSYKDIEVIIVEDCSTDNSLKIIEKLLPKYNNIKLIKNQVNSGAGYSRNIGIKQAQGEWISLIDADDWIDEDYYQTYLDNVEKDVDIIFGECRIISDDNDDIIAYKRNNICYSNINYVIKNLSSLKFQFLTVSLIKRNLFVDFDYCHSRFIEDTPTAYLLLFNSKKIQTIDYCGYNYYQEPNSLTHSYKDIFTNLYYCYNMIYVIEYFNKKDKELSEIVKKDIENCFKQTFCLYASDYDDIKPIFDKIDDLMSYFDVTKEYMHEKKIISITCSNVKITKIK